jgi:hypothetical protein
MRGAGALLIMVGVLLIFLTYTQKTGQFIGAIIRAK